MSSDDVLSLAEKALVSLSTGDAAAQMGEANMVFGLAKILWAQAADGVEPGAAFVASPDATITRNSARWRSGFGYGGKLFWRWPEPSVVLDTKPNCCGMMVGGLKAAPDTTVLSRAVQDLLSTPVDLDGIPVEWDFATSNHFIDVFEARSMAGDGDLPPYVFIVHSSVPELRGPGPLGLGLYVDKSPALVEQARLYETPWGPLRVLHGDDAVEYLAFFERADRFAAAKRELAATQLFGEYTPISNIVHQGTIADGVMLLGCHDAASQQLLPLTLRPDLPAYLMRGMANLRPDFIEREGLAVGRPDFVREWLENANIVPHGGGYALEGMRRLKRAWSDGGLRFFELERETAGMVDLVTDPTSLPMRYRGRQVLMKSLECGLAEAVARLDQVFVIKA
jgi:hypothetical protein